MHANLSLLHTSNAEAIEQALEKLGFPTPPNLAPKPEIQKIYSYLTDTQELKLRMDRCGLHDVAYVPLTIWDRLCNTAHLYQFTPHPDGTVSGTYEPFIEQAQATVCQERVHVERERSTLFFLYLILLAGTLLTYMYTAWLPGLWTLGFIGLVLIGFALNAGEYFGYCMLPQEVRFDEALRTLVTTHEKHGTLPETLWPLYKEPLSGGVRIPIAFPTPPSSVQGMMDRVRAQRYHISFAVTKEAITFLSNLVDGVMEYRYLWSNEDISRGTCPLLYLVHNSAVAVFAQYGDFPIESALIDAVVRDEYHFATLKE